MTDLKASSLRALKLMELTTMNDDGTIRPKLRSAIPPLSVSILALSRLLAKL